MQLPTHRLPIRFVSQLARIAAGPLVALCGLATPGIALTTISSVNPRAVPVGEKMTFTGSGFTNTSAVTFYWGPSVNSANFEVVSDTELKVAFPDVTQNTRDYFVLVETPGGSTVTLAGNVTEFTGTGTLPNFPPKEQIVVKAGAVLEGFSPGSRFVYVESGAVLRNLPATASGCTIFAEDGATLDLRDTTFSGYTPPRILHSPGTTILGTLPAPNDGIGTSAKPRQISSISLSRNIGPFTLGVPLNVTVVGSGSVSMDPGGTYVPHSTDCTLTATAEPGWVFRGWSGEVTSPNPVITVNSGTSAKNLTATFTAGYTLETYSGSRGTVTRDPQSDAHAPGQSVSLTAVPAPGYRFTGWSGALSESSGNPASLVMDANKLVTAVFEPITPPAVTRISSVDHSAVPVGTTMTFSGTGFTGTSAVTFFWMNFADTAAFEIVSDAELKVSFPDVFQNIRDRFVLVETPAGSTVTVAGEVVEFTGIGALPAFPPTEQVVVKAGAVLQGFSPGSRFVYVESGAVLRNLPPSASGCTIFAEDGATLDLRDTTFSSSTPPRIFYSAGTTILGALPAPSGGLGTPVKPRQIASISLSRGVGPFTLGVPINVSVVGGGSFTMDPAGTYVPHDTRITLTAIAEPGWSFSGWSGAVTSADPVITVNSETSVKNIVATFTAGYTLETYSGSWGTITRDPQSDAYASGQSVSLTAVPAPGYQFAGWGGALQKSSGNPASLVMDANKLVTAVFEPVTPPAVTRISAVDHAAVPAGTTMTFSGTGFSGTSAVTFFWMNFANTAAFEVVSDTELKVVFPAVSQPARDRFVVVETPGGWTVTVAGNVVEFTGTGTLPNFPPMEQVIVKAGAVLQGISPASRFVYVESGAVLRGLPSIMQNCTIFAEDGATLDFRGTTFPNSTSPRIFHSPGTVILGSLPPPATGLGGPAMPPRQIPPVSLSRGIGPFREGFKLVLDVEGPGRVTVDPVQDFYPRGAAILLTAVPDPENHFVRWTGAISSTLNPVTYAINSSLPVKARFSNRPDFFTDWRSRFFTPAQLADPVVSGLDADPDKDQVTNAGEYAFGTDPTVPSNQGGLRILPGGSPQANGEIRLEYTRPLRAADINYLLQARRAGAGAWLDGSTGDITFDVSEAEVVPGEQDMETVTLLVKFTGEIPNSLFFQLSADITDLP